MVSEDEEDPGCNSSSEVDEADGLLSWAVGVAFGRYAPTLVLSEKQVRRDATGPFASASNNSSGVRPDSIPPFHPASGVLVDDIGHPDDLPRIIGDILDLVKIDQVKAIETARVREWLSHRFFAQHIKLYSRNRRKAPIWWQLSTPSKMYSVWVSMHDLTSDTLYRVKSDYVQPKLRHVRALLEEAVIAEAGRDVGATADKELESLTLLAAELQSMVEELDMVALLWKPHFADGVVLNSALWWRLFPQNASWQHELKTAWLSMCAGGCDWTGAAMQLWPERVVPKCAVDRSLAIAHALEDNFWLEIGDGKWIARQEPLRSIADLVSERTSVAIKDALRRFSESPDPLASAKRVVRTKVR